MKKFNRREFIKSAGLISASCLTPGFLKAFAGNKSNGGASFAKYNGNRIVMIQLSGGNDGLNTVIPTGNDIYYRSRPQLAVAGTEALRLTDSAALNPQMTGLKEMYDNGEVGIISSVGYPNPDRSHFRSMDIWQSASSSNEYLNTGWIGRYLDSDCSACIHPYSAIHIDTVLALAMKGSFRSGIAVKDPAMYRMDGRDFLKRVASQNAGFTTGSELGFLYKTLTGITSSADYISSHADVYRSSLDYPDSEFGNSLKTIAELINSGVEASVYYASLSGFDTHAGQKGRQERLLKQLSDGLKVFSADLKTTGTFKETVIMCFSEFGRRVEENASKGTDHGSANIVLLCGGSLRKSGMLNEVPDLTDLDNGDVMFGTDFRSIYSTLLRNHLKADDRMILKNDFGDLGFC